MLMISNFLFNFINFVLWSVFLTKLLKLAILFSTAVIELVVANLVMLHISPLASFVLTLRVVLVAKLIISGILSSIFFILTLYAYFLTTSFFTTSLNLLKSARTST